MSFSNNSASMPSLYDTSISASSTGSRSPNFFPKSHPKPPASYYNQYSFASTAKKASHGERSAQSEFGWMAPLQQEGVAIRTSSVQRRQKPMYAASEPGIANRPIESTESDRFVGYVNRLSETAAQKDQRSDEDRTKNEAAVQSRSQSYVGTAAPSSQLENSRHAKRFEYPLQTNEHGGNTVEDVHRYRYQSREERPGRGRSPEGNRYTGGSSDDNNLRATDRSRSISSTQRFSKVRMEPRSNISSETTNQNSVGQIHHRSSPILRSQSPSSLDRSFYEKSSSLELSFAERSSDLSFHERSNDRPVQEQQTSTREISGRSHPKEALPSYHERVEIETMTPTSVRDLKQRLWDPDETLHHWHSQNERLQKSQMGPRRLGFSTTMKSPDSNNATESTSTTSSTLRSLSPKPSRVEDSSRVNMLLLNSRYSRAAARVTSRSPSRKASAMQYESPVRIDSAIDSVQSELQPRNLSKPQTNSTTTNDETQPDPDARVTSGVKAESDVTAVMANKSVISLMAKISAVKRNDPAEALAQIDAILSAESFNTEAQRENEIGSFPQDSDFENDVHNHTEEQARDRQTQEVARDSLEPHFDDESSIATSVSSMTNPTYQEISTRRNTVLSFSNKPSLLRAYGSTAIGSKCEWLRSSNKKELKSPPPPTISLSSRDKGRKHGETRQHRQFHMPTWEESPTFPQIIASSSIELADKIRRWDEMSAVASEDSAYPVETSAHVSKNTLVANRRAHPWDYSINPHSTQVEMHSSNANSANWTKQYKSQKSAENIKYLATDDRFDDESNSILANPSGSSLNKGDDDPNRINWGQSIQLKENAFDSFDTTWVSVPKSAFFQENSELRLADIEPEQSGAALPSRSIVSSFDQEDDVSSPRPPFRSPRIDRLHCDDLPTQYEVPRGDRCTMQTFSPRTREPTRDFRSLSPREFRSEQILRQVSSGDSSVENGADATLLKNKPMSRGLRSFLPKRRALKSNIGVLDHNFFYSSRTSDSIAMDIEAPPPLHSRGRHYGSQQDRERSRSLEDSRSRNPNIAQKVSRFLRVHDGDKEKGLI